MLTICWLASEIGVETHSLILHLLNPFSAAGPAQLVSVFHELMLVCRDQRVARIHAARLYQLFARFVNIGAECEIGVVCFLGYALTRAAGLFALDVVHPLVNGFVKLHV